MRFRPCIDIHNGSVKQIVGGSLRDAGGQAHNNYVSEYDGAYYADMYRRDGFYGGHIILLNPVGSEWYEADLRQAQGALNAFQGGMQIGGGICLENAEHFLDMGASHVIVTSYVFRNGAVDFERLKALSALTGKDRLVLDLSCRRYEDGYYIMTDRWQNKTNVRLTTETMLMLQDYCDEFLVHAVDVEGRQNGVERELVSFLGHENICPVTYAGGIYSMEDLAYLESEGRKRLDFTIGSALDLFGGNLVYQDMLKYR